MVRAVNNRKTQGLMPSVSAQSKADQSEAEVKVTITIPKNGTQQTYCCKGRISFTDVTDTSDQHENPYSRVDQVTNAFRKLFPGTIPTLSVKHEFKAFIDPNDSSIE